MKRSKISGPLDETGIFSIEQALASSSVRREDKQPVKMAQYPVAVFCNGTFHLDSSPLGRQTPVNQPFDISTPRIQFHTNHTFQACGPNKIFRDRYGVREELTFSTSTSAKEVLWFQVSLFLAGSSAPSLVYSEGIGLQKEDQLMYVDEISGKVDDNHGLVLEGTTMLGSDLGADAVGGFEW